MLDHYYIRWYFTIFSSSLQPRSCQWSTTTVSPTLSHGVKCQKRMTFLLFKLWLITFVITNFLSAALLLSRPITRLPKLPLDLLHINVAVNEVNGSLTLGTLGYCLNVSDQNICPSPYRAAYAIGQFFSNHYRIFMTSSYFL